MFAIRDMENSRHRITRAILESNTAVGAIVQHLEGEVTILYLWVERGVDVVVRARMCLCIYAECHACNLHCVSSDLVRDMRTEKA